MNKKDNLKALEIMKLNKVYQLYRTSDGNYFLNTNAANNHAMREHGAKRKEKLKIETITASSVGLEEDTPKVKDTPKVTKEELEKEYDVLFEKHESALAIVKEKQEALTLANKIADQAKETDAHAEKVELAKKALTAFKTAETKAKNIIVSLEEIEAKIED